MFKYDQTNFTDNLQTHWFLLLYVDWVNTHAIECVVVSIEIGWVSMHEELVWISLSKVENKGLNQQKQVTFRW